MALLNSLKYPVKEIENKRKVQKYKKNICKNYTYNRPVSFAFTSNWYPAQPSTQAKIRSSHME